MPQDTAERPATLEEIISAVAKANGVAPNLALAVARKESGLDLSAVGDGGKALGIFQLHQGAGQDTGVDRNDPLGNITGGVKYLKQLSDRYQGDVQKTLWAYNGGLDNVDKGSVSPAAQAYAVDVLTNLSSASRPGAAAPQVKTPALDPLKPAASPVTPVKPYLAQKGEQYGVDFPAPTPTVKDRMNQALDQAQKDVLGTRSYAPKNAAEAKSLIDATGPGAGAMVGAARGAAMGAPAGPVAAAVGGIAGAGVGAFGGSAVTQGLDYLAEKFGLVPSSSPRAETISQRAEQAGGAANTAMMAQVLGDAGITVLTPVARFVSGPLRSKVEKYAQEALAMFGSDSKTILPSEISKSRGLTIAENVAEGSLTGGSRVTAVKQARQGAAEGKVQGILASAGPQVGRKTAGQSALASRVEGVKDFRSAEKRVYGKFEEQAADVPVTTPRLDAFIAEQGGQQGNILPNAGAEAARRVADMLTDVGEGVSAKLLTAKGYAPDIIQAAQEQGAIQAKAPITAVTLSRTVSDIGKLVRALGKSAESDPSKYNAQLGLAKKVYALAKEDLVASLKANPAAASAYEKATTISRLGNQRLFNESVMDMEGLAPEKIVSLVLQPNNSTAIEAIHKAVGEPAMQEIRRSALDHLVRVDPRTGQINWGAIAGRLQVLGSDTTNALFPKGQAADLEKLSRLMLNLQQKPSTGLGRTVIALTQYGALAGTATGVASGHPAAALGSSVFVIAPSVMSRIMASPTGLKWLTTGLEAPLGSEAAIKAGVMLTAFLRQQDENKPVASHAQPVAASK